METGDVQVCGRTCEEAGYAGTETCNAQVGGRPRVVTNSGNIEAEESW